MFSHVLSNYQGSFITFATKVAQTLTATADTMNATPQYEFSILKELSQTLGEGESKQEVTPQDKDQMLFFQDEFKDDNPETSEKPKTDNENDKEPSNERDAKPSTSVNLIDTSYLESESSSGNAGILSELAGLQLDCGDGQGGVGTFLPSQLLQNSSSLLQGLMTPVSSNNNQTQAVKSVHTSKPAPSSVVPKKEDKAAWFKLFAELDPLANPDNLPGSNTNQSHAA